MNMHRWDLIAELIETNQYKTICEIGPSKCVTMVGVLRKLRNKKYQIDVYYGIDPYLQEYFSISKEDQEDIYLHHPEVKFIKKTSDDAVGDLKEPLDLVFIDGLHTKEQVEKDIVNYSKLIRDGGVIVGHDYVPYMFGCKAVVDKIIGEENINVVQDKRLENDKINFL